VTVEEEEEDDEGEGEEKDIAGERKKRARG
jgi:hypothetical protein